MLIKNDKGQFMPVEEWLQYYRMLLQEKGLSESVIDLYVLLKKAEFEQE